MEKQIIYLDEEGFKEHLKSIEILKEKLRKLKKEKTFAYENSGDGFHDNFEFDEARREMDKILYEIQEKTLQIEKIVIIEKKEEDAIELNDILSLTLISGNNTRTNLYKLVSTFKLANEDDQYVYLSLNSPIGKAIYHKHEGEQVECEINGKKILIIIGNKVKEETLEKKRIKNK